MSSREPRGDPSSGTEADEAAEARVGPVRAWWPVAAWATAILVGTSIPSPGVVEPGGLPVDKIVHVVMYFGLAGTIVRALRLSGCSTHGVLLLSALAAAAFAGLDEWHQGWVGRNPELGDWLADAVGLMLGVGVFGFGRGRTGEDGAGTSPPDRRTETGSSGEPGT